ncbi:Gfo/Idh/MocA family protein [Autumnicola musiva]|uniref:Gfo/Idh/MocA family oxidoreductase n=1 Tax=Autumnicola musiva TaxID=3075589 RepID=A0ABU3D6K9_9FLAO|nr:Gfo/Idh/MocA family oxidoreductase [Zunongwangia sp. F117]MDT0676653.1 Gfo/Idh/MocA family oxidoreductase [Zunongwangia sp. F117]
MIPAEPITEQNKSLALGFIGVGWIGRNRMEVLLRDTNSKALMIAEPSEENIKEAAKSAKTAKLASSSSEIFRNKHLDGVIIATPSAMHAEQAIEALTSGKSVFCQKPLGRTAAEVQSVVKAAEEADKLLAVDLSYRYTKAFQAVYNLIKSREIGDIYAADLVFHNAYGPDKEWFYDIQKSGGGCVMDLGIHLMDLALWTLDFPEITEVKSHLYHQGQKLTSFNEHVEDFASVSMTSEKDTHINLECSWNISAGQDAVIEARFYGTRGGAAFKNVNGSFYDFTAEKYIGTYSETLVTPPDDWSGRAGVVWAEALATGKGFDRESAEEFIKTTKILDRIYGR